MDCGQKRVNFGQISELGTRNQDTLLSHTLTSFFVQGTSYRMSQCCSKLVSSRLIATCFTTAAQYGIQYESGEEGPDVKLTRTLARTRVQEMESRESTTAVSSQGGDLGGERIPRERDEVLRVIQSCSAHSSRIWSGCVPVLAQHRQGAAAAAAAAAAAGLSTAGNTEDKMDLGVRTHEVAVGKAADGEANRSVVRDLRAAGDEAK